MSRPTAQRVELTGTAARIGPWAARHLGTKLFCFEFVSEFVSADDAHAPFYFLSGDLRAIPPTWREPCHTGSRGHIPPG
jgi:hypothetical protein